MQIIIFLGGACEAESGFNVLNNVGEGILGEHAICYLISPVFSCSELDWIDNAELFLSQEAWPFWASEETLSHPGLSCLPVLLGTGSFR